MPLIKAVLNTHLKICKAYTDVSPGEQGTWACDRERNGGHSDSSIHFKYQMNNIMVIMDVKFLMRFSKGACRLH